ncbi:MAG TPA: hypothetical protein VFE59_34770 [Trebonia sp.]|jgi:hypothetical protein|nr:hypothetical protein [Trebonia sp.]
MAEREDAEHEGYGDWRSLDLAIKDAAKKAARQAGPAISAASRTTKDVDLAALHASGLADAERWPRWRQSISGITSLPA